MPQSIVLSNDWTWILEWTSCSKHTNINITHLKKLNIQLIPALWLSHKAEPPHSTSQQQELHHQLAISLKVLWKTKKINYIKNSPKALTKTLLCRSKLYVSTNLVIRRSKLYNCWEFCSNFFIIFSKLLTEWVYSCID